MDPLKLLESSGLARLGILLDALESLDTVEPSEYFKLGSPLDTLERLELLLFKDLGFVRLGKLVVEEGVLKVVDSSSPLCGSLMSRSFCFLMLFSFQ